MLQVAGKNDDRIHSYYLRTCTINPDYEKKIYAVNPVEEMRPIIYFT